MAELLVLTTGGVSRTMFRGDVVTVQEDGFNWTPAEREPGGVFTIIRVPGVPAETLSRLLIGVYRNGNEILYRKLGLNLLLLSGEQVTFEQLQKACVEKTTIPLLT